MLASLVILLLLCAPWSAAAATESHYLKEILMGRCYFTPPIKGEHDTADSCPSLVGSFMNVLESNLDADIDATDFDVYLEQADFSSPPDKALFYLRVFGGDDETPTFTPPAAGLVSPEYTPGGKLLKDLIFCGVDQRGNCSVEKSNAYWTFWEAGTCRSV